MCWFIIPRIARAERLLSTPGSGILILKNKRDKVNAMNYLIVIDMQVDFISGALGSDRARAIVPKVVELVKDFDGKVIFTRDTHGKNYLRTQEGRNLPVEHCIQGTPGWQICPELGGFAENIVDKLSFGSISLPRVLAQEGTPESITLCGLCTDICVISNAMILKSAFPETLIRVVSGACAGVTEKSHETALAAMEAVQIQVI